MTWFYRRLLELCEREGTTPSRVAKDIGLSNSSATYWKRGSIPKSDTLQLIADYFATTTDYLLGIDLSIKYQPPILQLASCFATLNPTGQRKAFEYIKDLSELPKYQKTSPQDVILDEEEPKESE